MTRRLIAYSLGRVEYADGLELQRLFGLARAQGLVEDALLLLEHPEVITLGRAATRKNIVATPAMLAAAGIEVFETNRGGDVTYHGPGQLVGYPIFHLPPGRQDVRRYVRDVEEAILRTLARFDLKGARVAQWPGVWLKPGTPQVAKIAAIGVHLSRWYTSHGFALNVATHLPHFELIVPCGIKEAGVTSMERELGRPLPRPEVERAVAESFAEVFEAELRFAQPARRSVSVAVIRGDQVLLLKRTPARGGFWQLVTGFVEPHEAPEQAAARELGEETGQPLEVQPLGYVHSFPLGEAVPPEWVEESAFVARWSEDLPVTLDPSEHEASRWVSWAEAIAELPFPGLKRAVELAQRAVKR